MTPQQFRLLVVCNQLLMFAGYVAQDMSDGSLPPELEVYAFSSLTVLERAYGEAAGDLLYLFWRALDVLTVVAAVGLCIPQKWGRTLFLACFVTEVLTGFLVPPYFVSSMWPGFVFALYGTTEGMILALAYFSHLKRMFEDAREAPDEDEDEQP